MDIYVLYRLYKIGAQEYGLILLVTRDRDKAERYKEKLTRLFGENHIFQVGKFGLEDTYIVDTVLEAYEYDKEVNITDDKVELGRIAKNSKRTSRNIEYLKLLNQIWGGGKNE